MGVRCVTTVSGRRLMAAVFAVSLGMSVAAKADPPVTSGLTAWYEGSNVTLVNSEVTAWNDSAGGDGAQNWTNGGAYGGGHCPSWVNDGTGPNGQPYVFFDRAGWDHLVYDDIRDMNIRTSFTMTFVIRPQRYSETGTRAGTVFSDFGATGNEYVGLEISADNTTWNAMVRDGGAPPVKVDVSCARAAYRDNWSIVTLRWDSGTDTLTLYQNGEVGDSKTNASFDSKTEWGDPADFGDARIGRTSHYGNRLAHMGIVEILMYDRALKEKELNQVHDYIKNKYWPPGSEKGTRRDREQVRRRRGGAETGADERPDVAGLVSDGRTRHSIVLCDGAIEPEKTAAEELAAYLEKSTGAVFPVTGENDIDAGGPGIYLGWTQFARRHGIEPEELDIDEFVVRSVGENLVLCGSRPRGTLYAVGEFLERFCGVRWLTFYGEEYVPPRKHLAMPNVSISQKPAFVVRDMMPGAAGDRSFAFLRINGHASALHMGHVPMPSEKWGGMQERWRGPHLAHTLQLYLPPAKYFTSHPEYFGLVDGKRVKDAQICMTSEKVRQVFLDILLERIAAEGDGIYSISYMEHPKQCRCEGCQALMTREGTPAAPLVDFVNDLAGRIRDRHPNVLLETLAYNMTFVPPETMTVADNAIVRLGHLNRHFFEPMTSSENKAGADCWRGWRKIAKNLALWGYPSYVLPHPNMARVYSEDLQFYKRLGVPRIFYQYGAANDRWTHGLADLRQYLLAKLMWNPEQDTDALIEDFCRHYYGPAGPFVAQYVDLLDDTYNQSDRQGVYYDKQALARKKDARLPDGVGRFRADCRAGVYPTGLHMWMAGFGFETYRYLSMDFLTAAHELFRQAEDQAKDDQCLLAKVRRARLSLDRISLSLFNRLAEEYGSTAGTLEGFPLNREEIGRRYLDTMSRDRFGIPTEEHQKTAKFLETAKQADKDKCEWLRGNYAEFFK